MEQDFNAEFTSCFFLHFLLSSASLSSLCFSCFCPTSFSPTFPCCCGCWCSYCRCQGEDDANDGDVYDDSFWLWFFSGLIIGWWWNTVCFVTLSQTLTCLNSCPLWFGMSEYADWTVRLTLPCCPLFIGKLPGISRGLVAHPAITAECLQAWTQTGRLFSSATTAGAVRPVWAFYFVSANESGSHR